MSPLPTLSGWAAATEGATRLAEATPLQLAAHAARKERQARAMETQAAIRKERLQAAIDTLHARLRAENAAIEAARKKYGDVHVHRMVHIQAACAAYYGVTRLDIISQRRTADVVRPRQVAMYLAKQMTPHSLPDIGRRFGGRDHTTALYTVRKITALLATDPQLAAEVAEIRSRIEAGT